MRVLVTGGAGFIGGNLCKRLLKEEFVSEVVVIDNLSTGHESTLRGLDLEFVIADILDDPSLTRAAHGVDAIVHLAALGSVPRSIDRPLPSHEANATGTLRVLEKARSEGNAHVLLASSSSVYGANPTLPKVESLQCLPMSPYAVSKLAAEQYAMAYSRCYDLPVLPFRFFNVFGPGQLPGHAYSAVIPSLLAAALSGRELTVHGDGEQSRDFTYVGTVVETIVDALRRRVVGSPVNLAFGTRTSVNGLITQIQENMSVELQVRYDPARPGDVKHSQANNALLQQRFPEIVPVPLALGLGETIEWMRRHLESNDGS